MLFNMAGNKKCHQHLVHKEIVHFLTFIFQTQFHANYTNRTESGALKKTVKNILHIFGRLIHHAAMGHDMVANDVIPIFSRVERNFDVDSTYINDLMYIDKKLTASFGWSPSRQIMSNDILRDANNNSNENKNGACITVDIAREQSEQHENATIESIEKRRLTVSACNATGSTVLESCV